MASRVFESLSAGFLEVPIIWWVISTTGSGALVASVALVGSLGYLVASPLGGVLADRFSKKRLVITMYLVDGSLTAAAGVLLLTDRLSIPLVLVFLVVTNLSTALRKPSLSALLPLIIPGETYQKGNATMGLADSIGSLSSYALAGVLTALITPGWTLLVGGGLLFAAVVSLAYLREPQVHSEPGAPVEGSKRKKNWLTEGIQAVGQSPLLLALVLTATLINFILSPLTVLLAPFAKSLMASASGFGLLSASVVLGQLLGLLFMNFFPLYRPIRVLALGTLGIALGLIGLAAMSALPGAMTAVAVMGFCASVMSTQLQVTLQRSVPPRLLGRAYGLLSALTMAAQPLGYAAAGGLLALYPIRLIFIGMGTLTALATTAWLRPGVRRRAASQGS